MGFTAVFDNLFMKLYENLNSEVSSILNESKGNFFPYRKISAPSLNNDTMFEFQDRFFIIERLEPAGSWLQLAFVIVDVHTKKVTRSKIKICKFNMVRGDNNGQ